MKMYLGLTKRNMLVYFKDRQAILFSLLTSIIIFGLYLLFLRNTFTEAISQTLATEPLIQALVQNEDLETFTNMKLLVGIIGSAVITVPFSCLATVTHDRENKVDQDMLATPVRRGQIVLAYFTASSLSAIIMTSVILTAGLIILQMNGSLYMDVSGILRAYGITALGCVSSTALFMNVVLLFRSASASSAFFGILSAVCNLFPASHTTILLRNALLGGILDHIDSGIGGLDGGRFTEAMRDVFTFRANMFGGALKTSGMLAYILAILGLSVAAMILMYSKNYKKK